MPTNPYPLPVDPSSGFQTPEIAQSDIAGRMMDAVFGPGWNALAPGVDASSGGSEAVSVVLPIFEQLNWISLSVIIILFIWIFAQGAIGTAHEGKPLGEKFHSIWVPARLAYAIGAVAPVAKGFCLLQLCILWSIGFSINMANWAWFVALDYQEQQVGQLVATLPPEVNSQVDQLVKGIYQIQAHQLYWATYHGEKYPLSGNGAYERREVEFGNGQKFIQLFWNTPEGSQIDQGHMGFVTIPYIGNASLLHAQEQAIRSLVQSCMTIAASAVANEDMAVPPDKLLEQAAYAYKNELRTFIASYYRESVPLQKQEAFRQFKEEGLYRGWISAGEYTWTMNGFLEGLNKDISSFPSVTLPFFDMIHAPDNEWNVQLVRAANVAERAFSMEAAAQAARGGNEEGIFAPANRILEKRVFAMADAMNSGDPIVSMSEVGHSIVTSVHIIVSTAIAANVLASTVEKGTEGWVGSFLSAITGGVAPAIIRGINSFLNWATPLLMLAMLPVYLMGLSLAYVLPVMPFIIWWGAVISWLILVIEAMVAAPLWCIGHALPEGDGFAGQHGGSGYMLLFGILLRPTLMVLGLIFAMVLTSVVGKFIAQAFEVFISGMMVDPLGTERSLGLAGSIVLIVIVGSFTIYVVHKLYGLINHLPDNVLRWVGFATAGTTMLDGAEDAVQSQSNQAFGVYNNAAAGGMGMGSPEGGDKEKDGDSSVANAGKDKNSQDWTPGDSGSDGPNR